jgi:hypothetical protein
MLCVCVIYRSLCECTDLYLQPTHSFIFKLVLLTVPLEACRSVASEVLPLKSYSLTEVAGVDVCPGSGGAVLVQAHRGAPTAADQWRCRLHWTTPEVATGVTVRAAAANPQVITDLFYLFIVHNSIMMKCTVDYLFIKFPSVC